MSDVLDLTILDSGSDNHAVALARCGSDCAVAQLPFGKELRELTEFRDWIESTVRGEAKKSPPTPADLKTFGKKLFAFTFRDEIADLYSRLSSNDVRLNLLSNRAEVQNLPWEYLQEPRKPSPRTGQCVVRVVPTIGQQLPAPQQLGAGVRVLFASAAPSDQGPVDWEDVRDALQRAFDATLPEKVNLKTIDGADVGSLLKAVKAEQFDIFHFSGHGQVKNGDGQLVLVNRKTQKSEYLTSQQVCSLLANRGIRLVVLSACLTATGNFKDDFAVLSAALIRSGIAAVVANQMPVSNKTIAPFVGALYGQLLQSGDIDLATTDGRIALYVDLGKGGASGLEWGIPTLYRHYAGAQLYKP